MARKPTYEELEQRVRELEQESAKSRLAEEVLLKKSKQQLLLLMDSIPAFVTYVNARELRYRFVNKSYADGFGMSPDQMIGRQVEEILGEEAYARALPYIDRARSGERISYENMVPLHGEPHWFVIDYVPEFDEQDTVNNIIVLAFDITERKRAEEALQESEERFRKAFSEAPIGMVLTNRDLKFFSSNPAFCQMLGYTVAEMNSRTFLDVTHPEHRDADKENVEKMWRGEIPHYRTQKRYLSKNGEVRWGSLSVSLIQGGDGEPLYCLAMVEDITDRKKAEEEREKLQAQLLQAQKMESVGRLAGGVAHDFNNMLGIIIGNAEMAAMQVDPDEPLYQGLQEILKASHRSADMVRQLLAFARKQTISPKVLDLNDTIPGMLKMLRRLIGEDIELHWIPGKEVGTVRMDPSQVNQILANLVVNSRDAIPGVGKITIESANAQFDEDYCRKRAEFVPGKYVLLAVSDTGTGMSPEIMKHLFDPFFTTKELGRGTGLGLATVYGIVTQNNGFIHVHSEPGQGTTLKIYLPRVEGEAILPLEKADDSKLPKGTETVLLAEDEGPLLNIARDILQRQGYTVLAARTPNEAIALSGKHQGEIHLLLTDVVMPEMNGRQLAERIRLDHPGLKCLFMSGYTANVVAHHGVLDEGVHFVEKPFSPRVLAGKVREVLDSPQS